MLEVISWLIIGMITHFIDCVVFQKIVMQEKFKITGKLVVLIIGFSIFDSYIDKTMGGLVRTLLANVNTIMILKLLYKQSIIKTTIYSLISYILYGISTVIAMVVFTKIGDVPQYQPAMEGLSMYVVNLFIYIIYIGIITRKKIKELIVKWATWNKEEEKISILLNTIVAIIYMYAVGYILLMKEYEMEIVIVFLIFFICSVIFVSGFFKEKSDNNELQTRYEAMNEYLKAYERMLAKKSREEHEHKNQLIIIRDQVHKNNRKLLRYIEGLIEKKEQSLEYDDIKKLKNIPEGGLKGLLYYKIEKMREEKLEIYVNVSNQLSKKKIWKEMGKDLRDISMSLGVYLDNAIEAAKESKRKYIVMEIGYEEEEIVFEIANTYGEKIGKEGKSTKGIGRGQGLLLVKEIIEKNTKIREEKEISGGYYIQRLYYRTK